MINIFKNQSIVRGLLSACSMGFFCTSCSNSKYGETRSINAARQAYDNYNLPATLPSNPSNVCVKVSLSNRMAYVMEGGRALLVMPVTVGKSATPTPEGNFTIRSKNHYYRANTHGYAINGDVIRECSLKNKPAGWEFKGTPMPYWCEFKTAYGFHTGWMRSYPASGGCLRMHKNVAPKFYRLMSQGVPVSIEQSQPEDSTFGRNVSRPPDSTPFPGNPDGMMALTDKFFTMHPTPTYVNQ